MAPDAPTAPVLSRQEFGETLAAEAADVVRLVTARNESYAGADPLRCWRKRGLAGLLVRLEDKLYRYETFLERGEASEAEWRELLQDIGGYALCGLLWLRGGEDDLVFVSAAVSEEAR